MARTALARLLTSSLVLAAVVCPAGAQTSAAQKQTPHTAPQVEQAAPSYEGQNVTSVELAGQPDINPAEFKRYLQQQAGAPYRQAAVDASMAALKNTVRFKDVQLEVRPEAKGVRVIFVLQPAMYFGIYQFPGAAQRFAFSRLIQVSNYPPRGAYTPVDVENAQNDLLTFFRQNGYFTATVEPELRVDRQHGLVNVVFHTLLGKRAKFGKVDIQGPTPPETAKLRDALHSFMARIKSSAIREGKTYKLKTVQNATQYLESNLTGHDHLAARVQLVGADYNPQTNRADVVFHVDTGPIVKVKVEGAHLWPWTRHSLLPVYAQIGVDPELIQEGRQNLVSYFQNKGYFDVAVTSNVQKQDAGETILYQITKGPRNHVADVAIHGNQTLSDDDLLPHVSVHKRHFLNHGDFSDKLVSASVKNLESVYQAAGFSDVSVTPVVKRKGNDITVAFQVTEGERDIVQDLKIEGATIPESQFAPDGLKLAPGQPYSAQNIQADRAAVVARYLDLGYLTANFHATARRLPNEKHRLEVLYQITEGPRVVTANIITLGRKVTQPKLIALQTNNLRSGRPMKESDLFTAESQLYTVPGVFDWAEIDPRRTITTQDEEDVVIKVHEAKRNTLTYGFGFEVTNRGGSIPSGTVAVPGLPPVGLPHQFKTSQKTFWGPRGTFEYTRNNFRGRGESLSFSAGAGRLDQKGAIVFSDPMFRWSSWSESISVQGEHNSENPIFTSRLGQFNYQLDRPLKADKTQHLYLRYAYSQMGLSNVVIPDLVPPEDQHVRLSTLSASYQRDTRDNMLDAHKGIYESLEFDVNPKFLGSSTGFSKVLTQVAYYRKIPANIIWANSLRLGFLTAFGDNHIPVGQKFFSGGGSTLRGLPLNGAGPQRTVQLAGCTTRAGQVCVTTVPVGGNQLFILNSEFRIPVDQIKKGLGVVAFYDGGNVYQHIGFGDLFSQYTNTVGIGFRYATPVGPVRIDIGHNLNAQPGIKSTQFFITLGQAF